MACIDMTAHYYEVKKERFEGVTAYMFLLKIPQWLLS